MGPRWLAELSRPRLPAVLAGPHLRSRAPALWVPVLRMLAPVLPRAILTRANERSSSSCGRRWHNCMIR